MEVQKYPIDFDAVTKGQFFTNADLVQILGKPEADLKAFRFAVMSFAQQIQDRTHFTTKITEEGLHVLTDQQASEHNWKQFNSHKRGIVRRTRMMTDVDRAQLSTEEAQRHDARMLIQSRVLQAMRHASRQQKIESQQPQQIGAASQ